MNMIRGLLFDNNIDFIEYHKEISFTVDNISYEIICRNNSFYLSSFNELDSSIINLSFIELINKIKMLGGGSM